jgi:hypothetical protein
VAIDLAHRQIIADNGETFPITPDEHKALIVNCIQVAQREMLSRLRAVAEAAGLEVKEEPQGTPDEVPPSN